MALSLRPSRLGDLPAHKGTPRTGCTTRPQHAANRGPFRETIPADTIQTLIAKARTSMPKPPAEPFSISRRDTGTTTLVDALSRAGVKDQGRRSFGAEAKAVRLRSRCAREEPSAPAAGRRRIHPESGMRFVPQQFADRHDHGGRAPKGVPSGRDIARAQLHGSPPILEENRERALEKSAFPAVSIPSVTSCSEWRGEVPE